MNTTTRPTRTAPLPTGAPTGNLPQTIDNDPRLLNQRTTVMAPSAPERKAYPPKIAKSILHVTRNINPVAKAGYNEFHKYAYRKFEDVFEELVPLINDAGLIIQQNEIGLGNLQDAMISITYDFTIINEDGDVWPDRPQITAICKAVDGKGVRDDKAASKCNTQAQKYFYTSFFKIRTMDTSEADADAGGQRPAKRTAPSPSGEFKPHELPIVENETAAQWADRFKKMLVHAKTPEDVDSWYAANKRIFDRLAGAEGYKPVHEGLIDAMDARALELKPKEQAAQAQPQKADDGFPGDKKMEMPDIPPHLRRTAPPPPASNQEQGWLESLAAEYKSCNSLDEVVSVQESVMMPSKDTASQEIWDKAVELTKKHAERVANG